MRFVRLAVLVCAGLGVAPSWTQAGYFTQIVSFGDSLSDTGNVFDATGSPPSPYFNGHYSNGPISLEYLASNLGVAAPMPSQAGGTDYAWGGPETGTGTSFMGTPNLGTQIATFLATNPTITPTELFTVWGGANDFLNGGVTDYTIPVNNLAAEITALAAAGAKNFLVPNLPLLGMLPATSGLPAPVPAQLNALTLAFNADLAATLTSLQTSLGVKIYQVDVNGTFTSIISNPAAYGLTNVTQSAFVPSPFFLAANNGAGYLFWDTVHPTTQVQSIIGTAMFQAVPEPSSFALLAIAGVCLALPGARAWRRQAVSSIATNQPAGVSSRS